MFQSKANVIHGGKNNSSKSERHPKTCNQTRIHTIHTHSHGLRDRAGAGKQGRAGLYLSFGLDADLERLDPGGEDAGEGLAGERIEEVEARGRQLLEAPPSLHHADARLVHAGAQPTPRVPHLSLSVCIW